MLRFLAGVIFIALCLISYLFYENATLLGENEKLQQKISTQNQAIERQKIELEQYTCNLEAMKEYAANEYKKAFNKTKNDKTCEGRIKHLEAILKSYE